jgi:hypothetical protein
VCQSEEVETAGKVVYMAGETISYGRLVEILEKIVGRKVERKVWSVEFLKAGLKKSPEDAIKKCLVVFAKGAGASWNEDSQSGVGNGGHRCGNLSK